MPLFMCSRCHCVENTAVGNFWNSRAAPLCSESHTGKWHNKFPKKPATGYRMDADGYIYGEQMNLFPIIQ